MPAPPCGGHVKKTKHKVPPYSCAEEGARSLNGCHDDERQRSREMHPLFRAACGHLQCSARVHLGQMLAELTSGIEISVRAYTIGNVLGRRA